MKRFLLLLIAFFQLIICFSQAPQSWSSAEIYLALRKLNVLGSVLYVAAHPDDENTRLITYLSKEKLYRTGYLSMTRGDGGQNLIGDEQGIELGLIRTQELLAARRIDGGEQFFTRAYDFGYSKNPEETFSKWDKEKILSDVVWIIRKFRPDVIITRFPTTGEGGHGHHTASAILANEAFAAAADVNRFPEQLKTVQPWQAKRILWNTFNFGGNNTITPDQFKADVGGYSPLLGKSNGEMAADSRSQHKSQGFGVPAGRGEAFESFKTTGGNEPVNDLMDGVDCTWKKIAGGEIIEKKINELISAFDVQHPEKSIQGLVSLHKELNKLPAAYWQQQKLKEVEDIIIQCSGLFMEATAQKQFVVQADSFKVNFVINNRLGADAILQKIQIEGFDSLFSATLSKNKNFSFSKTLYVSAAKPITQPYWLVDQMAEGYFNISDQQKIGQPDVDAAYTAQFEVKIFGETFNFTRPVKYKYTDPVKGEVYQPVFVIPGATVMSEPSLLLFRNNTTSEKQVLVQLNANKNISGPLHYFLRTRDDIKSRIDTLDYAISQTKKVEFVISSNNRASDNNSQKKFITQTDSMVKAKAITTAQRSEMLKHFSQQDSKDFIYPYVQQNDSTAYYLSLRAINYNHIPSVKYFFSDVIKSVYLHLKTAGKKIGYIVGAGDKVPDALEQMGYEVTLLTEKELSKNNLAQFDAIIAGVRAYNTNEWLNQYYEKLMKYVKDGGNYIVQYNTSNFISSIKNLIGPYRFEISRTRITDENATVSFINPQHPVLNYPNKITADDFKDWIQERSIYHASNWDKNFETVLSMNDPGEKADEGSLVIAKYGKGYFTYTGLVFFRELPAGVPGAYRLLANLIAQNQLRGFKAPDDLPIKKSIRAGNPEKTRQ